MKPLREFGEEEICFFCCCSVVIVLLIPHWAQGHDQTTS